MHGFAYDAIHDEIVASGEEPPVRVIQGPHTLIDGPPNLGNDRVSIDPVNDEIYLPARMVKILMRRGYSI